MFIRYVRDENNHPIAMFTAELQADHVKIGYAVCHENEKAFSKKLGKQISLNRAKFCHSLPVLTIPERVYHDFLVFIDTCLERPAFKDKPFPRWVQNIKADFPHNMRPIQ